MHGLVAADDEVRAFFGPLQPGTMIANELRIDAIHGVRAGAIPVVLSKGERRFAVEILRHEIGSADPIGRAGSLALFLVNRGDGGTVTPEDVGLGVMALAHALEGRLREGASAPDDLWTHRERAARHPHGVFHVPFEDALARG